MPDNAARDVRSRAVAWWSRLSERRREFFVNVAIGIGISVLAGVFETNPVVEKVRDVLLTWQVAQFQSTDAAPRILWIDVDQKTYLRWHAPPVTPRDRICRMIDYAIRGRARLVVVDFDLTAPSLPGSYPPLEPCVGGIQASPAANSRAASPTAADAEFEDYLRTYAAACRESAKRSACPPVLLARGFHTSYVSVATDGSAVQAARPEIVDTALDASGPVYWSSPNFDVDPDAMVRRWRLWEPLCDPSDVLPSTELLAAALYYGGEAATLRSALAPFRPTCLSAAAPKRPAERADPAAESDVVLGADRSLHLTKDNAERRFFYRVGWNAPQDRALMSAFVPAASITDAAEAFDPALAANRIVVIGGSYRDNPDFKLTPLGMMPGTLVLINAIEAMLNQDSVRTPPLWLRAGTEISLILAVSAIFLYLPALTAMLVSSLIVVLSALTLGYVFLNLGWWIDPVLPLLGIQIHNLVALVEHRVRHGHRHKGESG